MIEGANMWEFFAGLGIFLFGLKLLEMALSNLAGRSFKRFLRKHTSNRIKAVLSGTIVTGFLQSSSIVSLMVLALVGAGIIELYNALGIVIGSNLGTTFTGWIVAYFGFQINIEEITFPLLAIGGLMVIFFNEKEKLLNSGKFIIGLGFLFLGLDYMKTSLEMLSNQFDLTQFKDLSPYLIFVVGFVFTAIIQSSSATMVITLSALNAGIIALPSAAALVIGSDLGTTITMIFGSIKGSPAKKRLALGQFLFNLVADVLALILLYPLLQLISETFLIKDPLMSLVAFHSLFNLIGILLFLPLLKRFAKWLNNRFLDRAVQVCKFIIGVPTNVPEIATVALRKEVSHLLERVFFLHLSVLHIDSSAFQEFNHVGELQLDNNYEQIKELEGEIVEFYLKIQNEQLERSDSIRLKQLILAIRYAMSSAKGIKDIKHNILDFDKSINDQVLFLIDTLKIQQQGLYLELFRTFRKSNPVTLFEELVDLRKLSKSNYDQFLDEIYNTVRKAEIPEVEISTILNVNREIYSSNKTYISAMKELLLPNHKAGSFDEASEAA